MSYQPIENYGIIGNMRTVALVGMNGSIDWYSTRTLIRPAFSGRSWMLVVEGPARIQRRTEWLRGGPQWHTSGPPAAMRRTTTTPVFKQMIFA